MVERILDYFLTQGGIQGIIIVVQALVIRWAIKRYDTKEGECKLLQQKYDALQEKRTEEVVNITNSFTAIATKQAVVNDEMVGIGRFTKDSLQRIAIWIENFEKQK